MGGEADSTALRKPHTVRAPETLPVWQLWPLDRPKGGVDRLGLRGGRLERRAVAHEVKRAIAGEFKFRPETPPASI